ncbi:unnamed protein product [Bursaphelenchus xylophilus]|uniref:(pine wood nematode) hypothetical protein n=1 Tax=Bursaphelenchus xylophilus TaxID=6326 RepID=A0A1I7SDQ1_BURXY|nr:unnamed protein product [Bursaphelenchus xylophilus]CAG9084443.1 unnamed protein product [Bursaphelenchus xylophilus]
MEMPSTHMHDEEQGFGMDDHEPLLLDPRRRHSNRIPVIGIIGLSFIFFFVISTVFFGALYYKKVKDEQAALPKWPSASYSLLGEYSKAAVAADNELCSEIGRDALLKGGNAIDAAIAALFCIGVMDTQSAGLGGGHFMTIYNSTTKTCHVVDARERAPLASSRDMYKDRWEKAQKGWEAVAVPGELHGLWNEYLKFGGRLNWSTLVEPTINLMKEGYPTSHAMAIALKQNEKDVLEEKTMRNHFLNPQTGKVYKAGEQITTRFNLIETLETIAYAEDPVKEFYSGSLASSMVKEFREKGGIITLEDFNQYKSIIRSEEDVIQVSLNDGLIGCGPPPPSSAAVTLAILGVTEGFKHNTKTLNGYTELFHRYIEASKFAYAQRSGLGDMDFERDALDLAKNITGKDWFAWVRSKIDEVTHEDAYYGGDFHMAAPDHGTTHISVIDKDGNAVSVTSTINLILGARVVSESTGILWNDQMDDFSLPGHPNYFNIPPSPANFIKPGKRPQSSMSPLVIFDSKTGKSQILSIGAAGGSTIISGVSGVAMHLLQTNLDVKQSIDFPRLHNQLRPNVTQYEERFPMEYIQSLEKKDHEFQAVKGLTVVTAVHKKGKSVWANSDFRKGPESEPAGY